MIAYSRNCRAESRATSLLKGVVKMEQTFSQSSLCVSRTLNWKRGERVFPSIPYV